MGCQSGSKRVLLTGVAGFVGSHLADRLIAENWEVVGLDNFMTGRPENIAHLEDEPQFHFIEGFVEELPPIVASFDWVMHFASPASPPRYQAAPIDCMRCNGEGTRLLLELAERNNAQFFLASTSEIYGDPAVHPQVESYLGNVNPIGPRSMYDESKRYAEAMTAAFQNTGRVDTRIIRIFNTYGPRMSPDDGRVVSNFICQALRGEALTVYGDGGQTRSFQHIDDLIEGIVRLIHKAFHLPVNLGNLQEFSILGLINVIQQVMKEQEIRITFCPLPGEDPARRRPDISRAMTLLNWKPRINLREGIERSVPYFREELARDRGKKPPVIPAGVGILPAINRPAEGPSPGMN